MKKMKTMSRAATAVAVTAAIASAQPADPVQPEPEPAPAPTPAPAPVPARAQPADPYASATPEPPAKPTKPKLKDPRIELPQLITTPTGWLLPAAVLYSATGLDTGGGFTSDNRVGLGDVAEFGIATLDQIRAKSAAGDSTHHIQPYVAATFRMGVAENRLFAGQPGLVLGFEKSFERDSDGASTRIAELTLVASKKLGSRAALHLGWAFWDASLAQGTATTTLHDRSSHPVTDQVRAFGGLQARPLDRSEILIDLGFAPEFCYGCAAPDQIQLRPELSWGVRYEVADWLHLQSGVRIADINNANLLDAQIFGELIFTSWGLRHAVDDLK